jgi:hypothetical protein
VAFLSPVIDLIAEQEGPLLKYYAQALPPISICTCIANTAWVEAQEGKDIDIALSMAQKAKSLEPKNPFHH